MRSSGYGGPPWHLFTAVEQTTSKIYWLKQQLIISHDSVSTLGSSPGPTQAAAFRWRTDWGLGSAGKAVNTGPLIPHGLSFSRRPNLASSCRDGKCSRGLKEDVKKYVSGEQINSMKECRNLSYKFSEITMLIRFSFRNVMK